jgi:hypothetical protein
VEGRATDRAAARGRRGRQQPVPALHQQPRTIAGLTGTIGSSTRAALWKPDGTGYVARDLGVYPGTSSVGVFGLDDQDRLVGWATLGGAIASIALPFMWSPATGMVNLRHRATRTSGRQR